MARNENAPLNDANKRFCEEYVANGYNGAKAYLAVKPDADPGVAYRYSWSLLKDKRIKEYIRQLEKDAFEANHINAEHIANELATIAFGTVTDNSRLSYSDKMKALELLGKQISLYVNKLDLGIGEITINITGEENNEG